MADSFSFAQLKVILINLDRSIKRREQMQERLSRLGLEYERLPAIDGKTQWQALLPSVDVPAFERHVGRKILPGEIGCYHSHLQAWQGLMHSTQEILLVLEDDVVFHDDFLYALEQLLLHQASWDMVKLNCIRAKQPWKQACIGPYALNVYWGPFTGMGAYLIKKETIACLWADMLPIVRPLDHQLDRLEKYRLRHYGLEPFPSHVHDEQLSTITGQAFQEVKKQLWYKRWPLYQDRLQHVLKRWTYLITLAFTKKT